MHSWCTITERLYDFLNTSDPPQKADCIFVLAGKQERKVYGIDLWKKGYAQELILSVGRFEWRRFYDLGLPTDGGLRSLVEATLPQERHFFVQLHNSEAKSSLIKIGRFGTMTEGRALAVQLEEGKHRSLMVVTTSIHLRRVVVVFRRAFRNSGIRLSFVAVPEELSSIRRHDLHNTPKSRNQVIGELLKYLGYVLFSWELF